MQENNVVVYSRSPEVVEREEDNEMLVLNTQNGEVKVLNESALLLWKTLASGPRTLQNLAEALCREYEVDLTVAMSDVKTFVDAMVSNGLLQQNINPEGKEVETR